MEQLIANKDLRDSDIMKICVALCVMGVLAYFAPIFVVPTALLLFGLLLSIAIRSFKPLRATSLIVQIIGVAASAFGLIAFELSGEAVRMLDDRMWMARGFLYLAILAASFFSAWMIHVLWVNPFTRNLPSVFGILDQIVLKRRQQPSIRVKNREALSAYSVADELKKWGELRDSGIVTEEEFSEARSKILRGELENRTSVER